MKVVKIIGGVIAVLIIIGVLFGDAETKVVEHEMQKIENSVAEDAVKQYEIAVRQGDKMQIYTQASLVSACYLQAKDEANYRKWKEIEKQAEKEAMAEGMKEFE